MINFYIFPVVITCILIRWRDFKKPKDKKNDGCFDHSIGFPWKLERNKFSMIIQWCCLRVQSDAVLKVTWLLSEIGVYLHPSDTVNTNFVTDPITFKIHQNLLNSNFLTRVSIYRVDWRDKIEILKLNGFCRSPIFARSH